MIGKSLFDFIVPEDIELTKKNLERRRGGIKKEFEKEFNHKDGSKIFTRLIASPIFDNDGNYKGAIAFVADITEKKLIENMLKESEIKFRTITEQSLRGLQFYKMGSLNTQMKHFQP